MIASTMPAATLVLMCTALFTICPALLSSQVRTCWRAALIWSSVMPSGPSRRAMGEGCPGVLGLSRFGMF